jgi:hypothetical protein
MMLVVVPPLELELAPPPSTFELSFLPLQPASSSANGKATQLASQIELPSERRRGMWESIVTRMVPPTKDFGSNMSRRSKSDHRKDANRPGNVFRFQLLGSLLMSLPESGRRAHPLNEKRRAPDSSSFFARVRRSQHRTTV